MARRVMTRRRLEALEATADWLTAPDPFPLGDVLAVAGVTLADFAADVGTCVDPEATDADSADAGLRISTTLERARRRMAGLPDLPDPIPVADHPDPPGPGWLSDGRHWRLVLTP